MYFPLVSVLQNLIEGCQVSKKYQGLQFPEPYEVAIHQYKVSFSQAATEAVPLAHS